MPLFKVFWYDLTRGLNPRSTECEADVFITTPSHRLTVFFSVSCDVLVFSGRLVSVYTRRQDLFYDLESRRVECSKKALFCGDSCDRNQAIILMVLLLVNL